MAGEAGYSYQYDTTTCPECNHDLTQEGGVLLGVSIGERVSEYRTELLPDGTLIDVDNLVHNGYHSYTVCGNNECGADLGENEV